MGFFGNLYNSAKNTFGSMINNPKQIFGNIGNSLFRLGDRITSIPVIGKTLSHIGDTLGVKDMVSNIQSGNLIGAYDSANRMGSNIGNFRKYYQR